MYYLIFIHLIKNCLHLLISVLLNGLNVFFKYLQVHSTARQHCYKNDIHCQTEKNLGYTEELKMSKTVTKSLLSKWQDEGVGAKVRRSIGRPEVRYSIIYIMHIVQSMQRALCNHE